MMNTNDTMQRWEGRYDQMVGWTKKKWGEMVDDISLQAKGNVQQFVGLLKQRTGASDEEIHDYLDAFDAQEDNATDDASRNA